MIDYLKCLLAIEESYLADLRARTKRYPVLEQAIAYRIGRVEAYKEMIWLYEQK